MSPNHHDRHQHHASLSHSPTSTKPSNEKLLCTAFLSFQCFAIAQTIAAIIAGSEAMLGDSAAMMVDAFTYLFNWYAERQKDLYAKKLKYQQQHQNAGHSLSLSSAAATIRALEYKKYTYQLELIPPLISVSTLLVVTGFVLKSSIRMLVLDSQRDPSQQANPNINLMMLFSILNLVLDILNVGCFARAKHALGYKTKNNNNDHNNNTKNNTNNNIRKHDATYSGVDADNDDSDNDENDNHSIHNEEEEEEDDDDDEFFDCYSNDDGDTCDIEMVGQKQQRRVENGRDDHSGENEDDGGHDSDDGIIDDMKVIDETSPMKSPKVADSSSAGQNGSGVQDGNYDDDDDEEEEEEEGSNLNMCSAYTHVFADTLRSLAVILASLLAEFTSSVTSEVADSAAAVVVSILIILSLVPLFSGMVQTYHSLKRVERQLGIEQRVSRQYNDNEREVIWEDPGSSHGSAIALVEFV